MTVVQRQCWGSRSLSMPQNTWDPSRTTAFVLCLHSTWMLRKPYGGTRSQDLVILFMRNRISAIMELLLWRKKPKHTTKKTQQTNKKRNQTKTPKQLNHKTKNICSLLQQERVWGFDFQNSWFQSFFCSFKDPWIARFLGVFCSKTGQQRVPNPQEGEHPSPLSSHASP